MKEYHHRRISLNPLRQVFPGWWIVTACAAIGAYGGGVYFYGFTLFFNPLKDELQLTSAQTSLVFSLTRLEGAFEGAVVGYLIDRYGSRIIMKVGVLMAGIGFLLWATVVDSYWTFIIVYVGVIALGINGGFFHPALAVANNWFIRRRAMAMSILGVAVGIGGAILVPLLAFIINTQGWRTAAFLSGIGLILFIWPLTFFIRHSPESVGLLPDGVTAKSPDEVSLSRDSQQNWDGHQEQGAAALMLLEEVNFTVGQAFRTSSMWIFLAAITLRFTAHTAIMVHLAPLMEDRGMSTVAAGGAVGILVLLTIPGRLVVGWLGDRYPKRKLMTGCLLIQTISLIVLYTATSVWQLYLFIALWATAYGAGILNWAIVGDYFGRARFATLRGLMGLVYSWGAIVGPVYAGWVHDTTGAYTSAILVFAIITGAAMILYWFCYPPRWAPNSTS